MSRRSSGAPEPNPVWENFAARHPGHPHLAVNPLVALPADTLAPLAKVKGLFDPTDLKFEHDLTSSVLRGFFHRRPMSARPFLPPPTEFSADRTIEEVSRENGYTGALTGRGIGEATVRIELPSMLTEAREQAFAEKHVPTTVARKLQERGDEVGDKLVWRKEAYVGWLVLCPAYRRELEAIRSRWHESVTEWGRIPHPATSKGEAGVLECARDVGAFCRRWCLERLWGWEWPEPRSPNLADGLPPTPLDPMEGVTLTLPWSMLRGKQIDFHKVVHDLRLEQTPEHLRDWVVADQPQRGVKSGEIQHRMVFVLYRTLVLALHRRYPVSQGGLIERVDPVVASVLDVGTETVKRARLKLLRGLTAGPA